MRHLTVLMLSILPLACSQSDGAQAQSAPRWNLPKKALAFNSQWRASLNLTPRLGSAQFIPSPLPKWNPSTGLSSFKTPAHTT
jgi:hypothetical protein